MPITLPPISRRRFLTRSLAAGAGLALAPRLAAAGRETDPNSWALLADTHIAADRALRVRGVTMAGNLTAVSGEIAAWSSRPAGVFVLGDCAYSSGEIDDYKTLVELLRSLREDGIPQHLALGNHDNLERFRQAVPEERAAERPVANKHTAIVRGLRANWFILDSLERTLSTPGLLGREQLDWLKKALDESNDKPALILVHHNPGRMENIDGIKDTEALFEVIRPRQAVKACFFGHTHYWSMKRDESGIHLINLPPVAYVFREGAPNGWVHVTLERGGARLELRCLDRAHRVNRQVSPLEWRA